MPEVGSDLINPSDNGLLFNGGQVDFGRSLQVFSSRRTEDLVQDLINFAKTYPLGDPLESETIVVPSWGMERWLSLAIAQGADQGLAANYRFWFPGKAVKELVQIITGNELRGPRNLGDLKAPTDDDPWSREGMIWAILKVLPQLLVDRDFEPVATYLGLDENQILNGDIDPVVTRRRYQLARQISIFFDQYALYRPQWISAWISGQEPLEAVPDNIHGPWQVKLFRAVADLIGQPHYTTLIDQAITQLDSNGEFSDLPERLMIFGVSSLPPKFLDFFAALGRRINLGMFVVSPTKGYFGDTRTRKQVARDRDWDGGMEHPLLQSMGKIAFDFNELLTEKGISVHERDDGSGDGGKLSLLGQIQDDLHNRVNRINQPVPIDSLDDSIQFHSCHGQIRQVEVLRDALLRVFRDDQDIEPRDVVVICPDIETYAPLIDAVFSDGDDRETKESGSAGFFKIKYNIADRSQRGVNTAADVVLKLLALPDGRFALSEVIDLLSVPGVMAKFGLGETDLDLIKKWVVSSGVRWGANVTHKQTFLEIEDADLGQIEQNSWKFGLDRMLLGVAMPGEATGIVRLGDRDIYPGDGIEGNLARVLGRFAHFCDELLKVYEFFNENPVATIGDWQNHIKVLMAKFLELPEEHLYMSKMLLEIFNQVADFDIELDLATVCVLLEDRLALSGGSVGFLNGGVNFTALVPMRTLPFKVVCLLGMDDKEFPRQQPKSGFDLMAFDPKIGDRNARDDDRYLFIETLLSARRYFMAFWGGRSIRDNEELPPAVPISEFLDLISGSFTYSKGHSNAKASTPQKLRDGLIIQHPLQAFSVKAFLKDPDIPNAIRGFDKRALRGAKKLASRDLTKEKSDFFTMALPDNPPDPWIISVDDLAKFLEHPTKHFLYRRLGIYLDSDESDLEDRESFTFSPLEEWKFGDDYIKGALKEGLSWDGYIQKLGLEGRLPPGPLKQKVLVGVENKAQEIVDSVNKLYEQRGLRGQNNTDGQSIDINISGIRLVGPLDNLQDDLQIFPQYSSIKSSRVLHVFVKHLLASTINENVTTYLVGRRGIGGGDARYPAVVKFVGVPFGDNSKSTGERAALLLGKIVEWFKYSYRCPFLLFPGASRVYYDAVTRESQDQVPRSGDLFARKLAFNVGESSNSLASDSFSNDYGQGRDPWEAFLFKDTDPWLNPATGQGPVFSWEDQGMVRTQDGSRLKLYRPEEIALELWSIVLECIQD